MPRNLDTTLAAHLGDPVIRPAVFAEIRFRSGIERVWSGVGDFVGPNGHTFSGLGEFASVSPIGEGTDVKAEGTSVTLSGIGDTIIDIPGPPVTPPDPPFAGQMAWSFATLSPGATSFNYPPSIFNAHLGYMGTGGATPSAGSISISNGQSLPLDGIALEWGGFSLPPEIPPDAVITAIYPVVVFTALSIGGHMQMNCGTHVIPIAGGVQTGPNIGTTNIGAVSFQAQASNSVPGSAFIQMDMSFIGLAVYYTGTPRTKMSLLQEALGDVWVGAPAKIWFGLMNVGAATLLGVPYLVFSGVVDKPSVHIGTDTLSITLALENRLVNLQRANQRRYTAADQKIYFPTDMAFNWVESLNDIALRWGS